MVALSSCLLVLHLFVVLVVVVVLLRDLAQSMIVLAVYCESLRYYSQSKFCPLIGFGGKAGCFRGNFGTT